MPHRPNLGVWAPPRIGRDLLRQVRDCLADLPWYLVTPFLRPWHRTWGATPAEVAAAMPGDSLLPRVQYVCTRASLRFIVPELQDLRVGQWLSMVPKPSARTAFVVDSFQEPDWLLWRTPNRSWAWHLIQLPDGRTRLVNRLKTLYEWRRPFVPITVLMMECADFAMMRRMLGGIRDRAEAERTCHRTAGPV